MDVSDFISFSLLFVMFVAISLFRVVRRKELRAESFRSIGAMLEDLGHLADRLGLSRAREDERIVFRGNIETFPISVEIAQPILRIKIDLGASFPQSLSMKRFTGEESGQVQCKDPAFDRHFSVIGAKPEVLALMSPPARSTLLQIPTATIEQRVLAIEIRVAPRHVLSTELAIKNGITAAKWLTRARESIVRSLFDNAQIEPNPAAQIAYLECLLDHFRDPFVETQVRDLCLFCVKNEARIQNRLSALEFLLKHFPDHEVTREALLEATQDEAPMLQFFAADECYKRNIEDRGLSAFKALSQNGNAGKKRRRDALARLISLEHPRAWLDVLKICAAESSDLLRAKAYGAMASLEPEEICDLLADLVLHDDPEVALSAIHRLSPLPKELVQPILLGALQHRVPFVVEAVKDALGPIEPGRLTLAETDFQQGALSYADVETGALSLTEDSQKD